ncbi:DUF2341 domain-containing protein [Pseudonocardia sp. TMWB2A]|uniref:DUF2341 domain-containing protein n=1 Tax=Pseudonocardia sp. TMWB2A TaxID=687430 RepID=UPI00307E54A3
MKHPILASLCAALAMVVATPAAAWWNDGWTERRAVTLDSGTVAGVKEGLQRQPALIRLHNGVLDFSKVKADGSDLRFVAEDDKTPLNFHIEKFDPTAGLALVWVDVPTVAPASKQKIWLYYGNAGAKPGAASNATYDASRTLVLHLNEDAPVDATANRNQIVTAGYKPIADGLIAGAAKLDQSGSMQVAASQSMAAAAGAGTSFSVWVRPAAAQADQALIYTRKASAGGADVLQIGVRAGVPFLKLGATEAAATTPLAPDAWNHVGVSAGPEGAELFVNGVSVARIAGALPAIAGETIIGASGDIAALAGDYDEISQSNKAAPASAFALAATAQGRSSNFASVASEAEGAGSGGHNYFGILFGALTLDAWIVIAILGVMAAISWFVMITKGMLFGRTAKANSAFLAQYREELAKRNDAEMLVKTNIGQTAPDSSLAKLFETGQSELRNRVDETPRGHGRPAVAPESVAAIRSALDATQAREMQRLSKSMVLLTIAISGGPFLGLLGTVIGVMITFAGVAAAGDVNINAIAPGIAAALLATVAGLAVAIPALFGYNYLLGQQNNILTDNQVFSDELEKKYLETYRYQTHHAVAAE